MKIRKNIKSVLIILWILIFSFVFSSCSLFSLPEQETQENNDGGNQSGDNASEAQDFTIAYYSGETIDPYSSVNQSNRAVISLCYEGLIYLDSSSSPSARIADYSIEDNNIVFTIRSESRFSDGSSVTASDIVHSFQLASESDLYSFRFDNYIDDWEQLSSNTVRVSLKNSNLYNINLFDFPIVKEASVGVYPIGSGKYYISTSDGVLALHKNDYYQNSENFSFDTISLVEIQDSQDLNYNFNYGVIHAAYADLSDGAQRYKGNVELVTFMTNTLVFAAVNKSKPYLASSEISSAISRCIDRKRISEEELDSLGDIVWQPFNLNWRELENMQIKRDIYSSSEANTIFTENGLTLSDGVRVWRGSALELTVICNNEDRTRVNIANAVADSLREMGFSVNVVLYNWNDYREVIASGNYDIYIAETEIPMNFDIRYMFENGVVNSHSNISQNFLSVLDDFYSGESDIIDFLSAFNTEMPFIPLYYSRGALAVNRIVSGEFSPTETSIFEGIENWTMD